jgi:hypothetical protein
MDTALPLGISVGKTNILVLWNGAEVNNLQMFDLCINNNKGPITPTYKTLGPLPTTGAAPSDALSNSVYPLRMHLGSFDAMLTFQSRPFGGIKLIQLHLETEKKPIIRFEFATAPPEELVIALVDLGVEVVIEEPHAGI